MPNHPFYPEVRPVHPSKDQQIMDTILFVCAMLSVSVAIYLVLRFFWMLP